MENNQKKKYTLEIAGTSLTLVSDEGDAFVKAVSTKLDSRMSELLKSSFRVSILDAAILCALDYLGEDVKAEKKIRSLETQLELYEVKMRNMAEELERYRNAEKAGTPEGEQDRVQDVSAALRSDENGNSEDKIRTLEQYLESRKTVSRAPASDAKTREEKIKYIESLLRGTADNK